jgi:hypothetical protein
MLVEELLNHSRLEKLLRDSYGNYCIQVGVHTHRETTSTHCEYELLLEAREASSSSSEEREFSKRTRLGIPALRSWPLYTR